MSTLHDIIAKLQARVKDQAETILVQKAIYETLSAKVKELEAELDGAKKAAKFNLNQCEEFEEENAKLRKVVDAAREVLADPYSIYRSLIHRLEKAFRELDGDKKPTEMFAEKVKNALSFLNAKHMAEHFEVTETTVRMWAAGVSCPLPRMMKSVSDWIDAASRTRQAK